MKIDLKHCRLFAKEKGGEVREITEDLYFFEGQCIHKPSDIESGWVSGWEEIWIEFDEKDVESSQVPVLLEELSQLKTTIEILEDAAIERSLYD